MSVNIELQFLSRVLCPFGISVGQSDHCSESFGFPYHSSSDQYLLMYYLGDEQWSCKRPYFYKDIVTRLDNNNDDKFCFQAEYNIKIKKIKGTAFEVHFHAIIFQKPLCFGCVFIVYY